MEIVKTIVLRKSKHTLVSNSKKGVIIMPELSRFYGIIITMYFNDTQQHHKPHVHAFYGDYEAVIGIDGELLRNSSE